MPEQPSYRVVIVGAGFGGIGMGIALRRAGIDDVLIVDQAAELGGIWRDNTYPGLACDVPANLYSYSFRPWNWSRRFPPRQEILDYLRTLATENGLPERLRLGAGVSSAEFDAQAAEWTLTLTSGETLTAGSVVCAVGQLGRPAYPDIAGRDEFAGPSWHSGHWNHDVELAGKRIAVIGTGASAIQFVPEIAKTASHVDVYQRSAPYVIPKADRAYKPFEHTLFGRFPAAQKADRARVFLYGELLTSGFVLSPRLLAGPMMLWRRQLEAQISDPELREKCVPDYVMGCKRVLFSNDWYPALARSDVDLITEPVDRILADGIRTADGQLRPADVLIYGTGFTATEFLPALSVTGRDGRELHDAWRDRAEAYLGITVAGFPNFFLLYGPNTNLGGNSIIYMLEGQISYALAAIEALGQQDLAWLDVRPDVQRRFIDWVDEASRTTVWESGCHSWYTTDDGRNATNWPDHTFRYRQRVRHFDLGCYRVMPRTPAPALATAGTGQDGRA
ncbi:MAG TPA: NAD(P)/FAD-dependent oxidoreductase [Streptosporangiaceae bacterium]